MRRWPRQRSLVLVHFQAYTSSVIMITKLLVSVLLYRCRCPWSIESCAVLRAHTSSRFHNNYVCIEISSPVDKKQPNIIPVWSKCWSGGLASTAGWLYGIEATQPLNVSWQPFSGRMAKLVNDIDHYNYLIGYLPTVQRHTRSRPVQGPHAKKTCMDFILKPDRRSNPENYGC